MVESNPNARLISLRGARSWSQEDLARAAGVSARTVQRIEAGAAPSLESSRAIAAAFDSEPAEIFGAPAESVPVAPNLDRGVRWGIGGTLVGFASAVFGVGHSLVSGEISAWSAGVTLGGLGAITGLVCGGIGWLSRRAARAA